MRYIYHHLGLGDHLICNCLVRSVHRDGDILFCKPHNLPSVSFMYRDLPLKFQPVANDEEARAFVKNKECLKIGYLGEGWDEHTSTFEKHFYRQAGIPFEMKWEAFRVDRDPVRERKLEVVLRAPTGGFDPDYTNHRMMDGTYNFIHMDAGRSMTFIPPNGARVCVERMATDNIFDYCGIIERATEIHVIESVFMFLADLIPTKARLFAYRSARPLVPFEIPTTRKLWKIV